MAKTRKPFVSRKRRREMDAAREKRERLLISRETDRTTDLSQPINPEDKQTIQLPESATVGEFAEKLQQPVVKVISRLMKNGIMAAINDHIDFDTMAIVADELGFIAETQTTARHDIPVVSFNEPSQSLGNEPRPPVVTIMGHVDHGKTSLLDKIRQTHVTAHEFGGITQHIGAYQTEVMYEGQNRSITFLDTPGHEAFTALRSHGAQVTDIVVLVVAADDGVKPQTIEALNHAKMAGVPIIVAITKTDLASANSERVKQQLTEHGLIPEEWGGETIMTSVSAVNGEGIQNLLEYILLTADLKNYRADSSRAAQGVVIESHQEVGLGPVATVLVQNGTLHTGDVVVVGQSFGKIRSMTNYKGERVAQALPAMPVQIAGLESVPGFGESFAVMSSEREARETLTRTQNQTPAPKHSLADISQAIAEGRTDTLRIVLKADAQGSLEALKSAIAKLQAPGVKPVIIHNSIGDVTLSDIQLATASLAVVYGFNVGVPPAVKRAADNQGVTIATFKIIYDLLQQIEAILNGLVKVETQQVEKGRIKIKKVFRTTKDAQIIGGEITQGSAVTQASLTIMRDGEQIGHGKVLTLQKGPEVVSELQAGQECGLSVQSASKIQVGDVLIFSLEEEVIRTDNVA